jgi:hypothetical protein
LGASKVTGMIVRDSERIRTAAVSANAAAAYTRILEDNVPSWGIQTYVTIVRLYIAILDESSFIFWQVVPA